MLTTIMGPSVVGALANEVNAENIQRLWCPSEGKQGSRLMTTYELDFAGARAGACVYLNFQ
jgi:hypothetical protein